jgi:hypothetical protein
MPSKESREKNTAYKREEEKSGDSYKCTVHNAITLWDLQTKHSLIKQDNV